MAFDFQNNTGQAVRQDEQDWRASLRRKMLARRAALSEATRQALSARIVLHLQALMAADGPLPLRAGMVVGFCWPIKNEPDVRAAVSHWREFGISAALPVVLGADLPLAFRRWAESTPLADDCYGIPTPISGDYLLPDVLILPLNAFDAEGFRLGYGGGFFDRTLAALSPRPVAIGIGFECNRVATIRPQPHDQRLDWLVTEDCVCSLAGLG